MNNYPTKVLAVEDDAIAQRVLKMVLNPFDCTVHLANSGKEVLSLLEINNYALILMDIGLPDINGLDLCEIIQKKNPETPIVVVSAYSDDHYRQRLKSLGLDYVLKPITPEISKTIFKKYLPELVPHLKESI